MKTRQYHRENCKNCIRLTLKDSVGRTLVLSGIHAFEWKITIITRNSITSIEFKNRKEAIKEFNRYKRKPNATR